MTRESYRVYCGDCVFSGGRWGVALLGRFSDSKASKIARRSALPAFSKASGLLAFAHNRQQQGRNYQSQRQKLEPLPRPIVEPPSPIIQRTYEVAYRHSYLFGLCPSRLNDKQPVLGVWRVVYTIFWLHRDARNVKIGRLRNA
jgi:hypothetical protein